MRIKTLPLTLALSLVAYMGLSTTAPAATTTTSTFNVPLKFVHANDPDPDDPGNCSAIIYAQWTKRPGTESATVTFTAYGRKVVKYRDDPPFDKEYDLVATYYAPRGTHRIVVGEAWRDGPTPSDCSELSENQKKYVETKATVELTIKNRGTNEECADALEKYEKQNRAVQRLKRELQDANTDKEKAEIREQLDTAKARRARASASVGRLC